MCEVLLGGEDEVVAVVFQELGHGLASEEIVAGIDRPEGFEALAVAGMPALGGVALAILFRSTVVVRHELRHQRDDTGMAGGNDAGGEHDMIVLGLAVGPSARQAVRAADAVRTEILGAVEGNEAAPVKPQERFGHCRLGHGLLQPLETRLEQAGRSEIEMAADRGIAGDMADAEQRLTIRTPALILHLALIGQERTALHKEQRESRKPEIGHSDIAGTALAAIRKRRASRGQLLKKGGEVLHPHPESVFKRFGNPSRHF